MKRYYQGGGQEPQDQQQQIVMAIAKMLQQGAKPEQVMQKLVESGVEQSQAQQLVGSVMQQMQGGQEQPQQEDPNQQYGYGGMRKYQSGAIHNERNMTHNRLRDMVANGVITKESAIGRDILKRHPEMENPHVISTQTSPETKAWANKMLDSQLKYQEGAQIPQAPQQQGQPQGGQLPPEVMQLLQAFAQSQNLSPEQFQQLVQKFMQLAPEEQQEALQQIQQAMQDGDPNAQQQPPQEQQAMPQEQAAPVMQGGGQFLTRQGAVNALSLFNSPEVIGTTPQGLQDWGSMKEKQNEDLWNEAQKINSKTPNTLKVVGNPFAKRDSTATGKALSLFQMGAMTGPTKEDMLFAEAKQRDAELAQKSRDSHPMVLDDNDIRPEQYTVTKKDIPKLVDAHKEMQDYQQGLWATAQAKGLTNTPEFLKFVSSSKKRNGQWDGDNGKNTQALAALLANDGRGKSFVKEGNKISKKIEKIVSPTDRKLNNLYYDVNSEFDISSGGTYKNEEEIEKIQKKLDSRYLNNLAGSGFASGIPDTDNLYINPKRKNKHEDLELSGLRDNPLYSEIMKNKIREEARSKKTNSFFNQYFNL